MHITKLTDYALVLMCQMDTARVMSANTLSQGTKVPLATTNKLLKVLSQKGLCSSRPGKFGGFLLSKPHHKISLLDVILCIEGNQTHLTQCLSSTTCQLQSHCRISQKMQAIDHEIQQVLRNKMLSDLL